MKSEEQTPQPATPIQPAPATPYTTQWASGAIPIDPALQQQSQHATSSSYPHYQYTSHYPQAAYATHYQAYAPQAAQAQGTAVRPPTTPVTPYQTSTYSLNTTVAASASNNNNNAASGGGGGGSGMDTADIATLNDALGSAGVDLRAEEESLQRTQHDTSHSYRAYEDRTRKQPPKPSFDTRFLSETMRTHSNQHKITRIPDESVNYLALALRARLQDLVAAMIGAANHRTDTQFDRPASLYDEDKSPMWSIVVRTDVGKQLAALEKIEREEETRVRKERKERAEMTAAHAAALAAQANGAPGNLNGGGGPGGDGGGEEEGNVKKKRKKDGPGVTARNMSEDVRKKMSNAVATQAAGLGKYSWMTAAAASTPAPKPKAPATPALTPAAGQYSAAAPGAPTTPATTTSPSLGGANSTWARPYVPTKKNDPSNPSLLNSGLEDDNRTLITMRDAMFVVEKERGHGGGRGAARGWV